MHFDVISIFPEMFAAITQFGVSARGHQQGLWTFKAWSPRDFTQDNYRRIDDRPYGGGPGMVMLPGPLSLCLEAISRATHSAEEAQPATASHQKPPVILLSPQGTRMDQPLILELMAYARLTLLCGRYEAIDQRLVDTKVDMEVSIGDFVVSGGELPAMMLMDALIRRIPGVINDGESVLQDSFEDGLLDCPHYTRPESFEGLSVPDVLKSGHHLHIEKWRRERRLEATFLRRPDLIQLAKDKGVLSIEDRVFLGKLQKPRNTL